MLLGGAASVVAWGVADAARRSLAAPACALTEEDDTCGPPTTFGRVVGDRGAGAVVFLHGLLGSHAYWPAAFEEERTRAPRRRIFFDLPGFGRSIGVPPPYDLATQGERIVAACEGLAPDGPIVLVGHSLGALAALVLATTWTRVRAVVACNLPAFRSSDRARRSIARAGLMERWVASGSPYAERACRALCSNRELVRAVAPLLSPTLPMDVARAGVDHTWASFKQSFDALVGCAPIAALLARVAVPVHVLLGAHDDVCPPDVARRALAMTHARVRVVAGGHHLPLTATGACVAAVAAA